VSVALEPLLVGQQATVRELIERIDENMTGLALVVDDDRRLIATITDGDIRRAILAGMDLGATVDELISPKPRGGPITAPAGTSSDTLLEVMAREAIRHVPLVDEMGRVVDVALLDELARETRLPLRAVIMAGGLGSRLAPLTDATPKPMLPIGDRPLLERIVEQLRDAGIHHINITTHYRAEAIAEHFGDGTQFDIDLHYTNEDEPLGTAGALALLEDAKEPLLVMNGDILTRLDFRALLRFHEEHDADLTVALRPYELRVPYGIVDVDAERIVRITEKPALQGFFNAGIYLISPELRQLVPRGRHYDMNELIERALADGRRVIGFPVREYWLDIGDPHSYERAHAEHGARDDE
jgi:dTDP-glucose pyrophosphorylase/CBS domain-containing protein